MPETKTAPTPVALPTGGPLRLPALVAYRAAATRRRAAAFCEAPEHVLGIPVLPLTPRTFSMLLATDNSFITGKGQPQFEDIVNYLWIHSAAHSHIGVRGWAGRKRRVLRPLMFQIRQPLRKWVGLRPDVNRIAATLALAITDIAALVEEAFADSTAATGSPGAPVATLEATFIHIMGDAYRWAPERTRGVPLKQLFQLARCIRQSRGGDIEDAGEQAILAAHLRARNEALREWREAQAKSEATP